MKTRPKYLFRENEGSSFCEAKMDYLKKILVALIIYLSFSFSIADAPNRVEIYIINNSEMSMQTTISNMVLDNTGTECMPSMSQYSIAVIEPRTSKFGIVGGNDTNLCQLSISTFINGYTCFIKISPVPSTLEIIMPNEVGPGVCNRIIYR